MQAAEQYVNDQLANIAELGAEPGLSEEEIAVEQAAFDGAAATSETGPFALLGFIAGGAVGFALYEGAQYLSGR